MNFTCIGRTHGAPVVPVTRMEWERLRNEPWLAEMCRRIEAGEESLKHRLPIWTPHCAEFDNNHRSIKDALKPLQRLMMDFDEKGHSAEIMEKALRLQEEGRWEILLVEDSVRRGTHVLITLPPGMTAEEAQTRFSQDVGFQADGVVKDVSRCIYMVPASHTLYVNEEKLFSPCHPENHLSFRTEQSEVKNLENTVQPEVDAPILPLVKGVGGCSIGQDEASTRPTAATSPLPPSGGVGGGLFAGIPYSTLLEVLEDQMGGTPELGARNNFIFAMACHLRYICNDNPDWIAQVLPTYGEEREKWYNTIRSACNRPQSKLMSRVMRRTITICKARKAEEEEESDIRHQTSDIPPMPDRLPPLIDLLVSRTPAIYRPAVAHAVFPALGAHLWKTYFRYIDNVDHEATLMNVLMAGTGAGKNCISEPINRIMADIRRRDRENMQREKEWKNDTNAKGANKDRKLRPEGLVIQEIDPDTTNAAFVMRLNEAEEKFLYAKMNELDQFDALKNSGGAKNHFQIMCLAFDPGNIYGQTRSSTNSVCERVCIRFNWNASTTISKGQAYFRSVLTDGPISRINFCTIPERPIGAELPVYGTYDESFDQALKPYIDRLNQTRGRIECPEAEALAWQMLEENADIARLSQSRVYENLSFRANVIAYLKAMVLYVAHDGKWDKCIEEFVRWSLRYDLWCKMRFFGDAIEAQEEKDEKIPTKGPQNLLDLLPEIFSREEANSLRQRVGIRSDSLSQMLNNWKQRGYIEVYGEEVKRSEVNRQRYIKTEAYLKKHPQR